MVVTNTGDFSGEIYDGEMKVDQISKFIASQSRVERKVQKSLKFDKLNERSEKNLCNSSKLCLLVFVQEDNQV